MTYAHHLSRLHINLHTILYRGLRRFWKVGGSAPGAMLLVSGGGGAPTSLDGRRRRQV